MPCKSVCQIGETLRDWELGHLFSLEDCAFVIVFMPIAALLKAGFQIDQQNLQTK